MRTHPPMDRELEAALTAAGLPASRPLIADLIPLIRTSPAAMGPPIEDLRRGGLIDVRELTVPGPAGAPDISLLVARPAGLDGALPAVYNIHGGGMIVGDNRVGVDGLLDWAVEFGLAIVSVEYRLAPENPHPAPVEDCFAGLAWTVEHAADLGIDPDRVVITGSSAGGGLAAAVALLARDRGGPRLLAQMLFCPMLDDRAITPSSRELQGAAVWDRRANEVGWTALLGAERGGPNVPVYAAPARARDLSGLPPTYVDVGSVETFRDEDVDYAVRIWQAGGDAELHVWPGGFHGFDSFAPGARLSQDAVAARRAWLARVLQG